jgi:hypothetical protein
MDKEISGSFFESMTRPFVSKGQWYDVELVDVGSKSGVIYSIDAWWYSSDYFITGQEFRDKKLTELGI